MKTLVKRSTALLLTLVLLLTMMPFTALAEAAENEDGMDGIMDILEANEEETDLTVSPDGTKIIDVWDADGNVFPDSPDDPGVEDDWRDRYTDDSETGTNPRIPGRMKNIGKKTRMRLICRVKMI